MTFFTQDRINRLNELLQKLLLLMREIKNVIWTCTSRDTLCLLIIILFAVLLRFPLISHPSESQFDEVVYVNYTLHTLFGEPYFDIHPPLARMIFTLITELNTPFQIHTITPRFGEPLQDFPYTPLRDLVAFAGVLLTLVVYAIGRALRYDPRTALLPALLIIFDSAFVVYSRAILPDTFLLLFNFLAILFALFAVRRGFPSILWLSLMSGIALGLAISIKWTALGIMLFLWILFTLYRKYTALVVSTFAAAFVYIVVFVGYFYIFFPLGGPINITQSSVNQPWIQAIEFPKGHSLNKILSLLPSYHQAMLHANQDPAVIKETMASANPLSWLVAKSNMIFWVKGGGTTLRDINITCAGNPASWIIGFFLLLFDVAWIWFAYRKTNTMPIDNGEVILLTGFLANYIPFLFIHRPMYLYHYFTALIFLFLLIPKVAPRFVRCLALISKDEMFANTFAYFSLLLVLVNFILMMPSTYGF